MRHPSTAVGFEWDEANEDKLAKRGIRFHEVEGVWRNEPRYYRNKKTGGAVWMMIGVDPDSGEEVEGWHHLGRRRRADP